MPASTTCRIKASDSDSCNVVVAVATTKRREEMRKRENRLSIFCCVTFRSLWLGGLFIKLKVPEIGGIPCRSCQDLNRSDPFVTLDLLILTDVMNLVCLMRCREYNPGGVRKMWVAYGGGKDGWPMGRRQVAG